MYKGSIKKKQKKIAKKAQSFLEYSVLISCLVAAIVGMQIFVKRSMQGRFREAADGLGGQYSPNQSDLTLNTVIDPISISTTPSAVWLKYPPGTIATNGTDISGEYVRDSYGLPVYGVESQTTYSETVKKSGTENMDKLETNLF